MKKKISKLIYISLLGLASIAMFFKCDNILTHAESEQYRFHSINPIDECINTITTIEELSFEDFTFDGWYDNIYYQGEEITDNYNTDTDYYAKWLYQGSVVFPYHINLNEFNNIDLGYLSYIDNTLTLNNVTLLTNENSFIKSNEDIHINLVNDNYLYSINESESTIKAIYSSKDVFLSGKGSLDLICKNSSEVIYINASNVTIKECSILSKKENAFNRIIDANNDVFIKNSNISIKSKENKNDFAISGSNIFIDESTFNIFGFSSIMKANNFLSIGTIDVNAIITNSNETSLSLGKIEGKEITCKDLDKEFIISYSKAIRVDISSSVITIDNDSFEYDGNVSIPNVIDVSIDGYSILPEDYSINYTQSVNAGTYTISIYGRNNFYGKASKEYIINPRKVSIKANDVTKKYDGKSTTHSYSYVEGSKEFVDDVLINVFDTATYPFDCGSYEIYIKGVFSKNYDVSLEKGTLNIIKADIDLSKVSFASENYTYDGKEKTITLEGSLPYGVSVTYENNSLTDAGSVIAKAKINVTSNYNEPDFLYATLTINKAVIQSDSIVFNSASYTYDGYEKVITISSILPKEIKVLYENNRLTNAGSVISKASFDVGNNYEPISSLFATLTINKADYNMSLVKFYDDSFTYDGSMKSIYIQGALPNGVSVRYEGNSLTNAGSSLATAYFIGDSNHNEIPSMSATIEIKKATYDMGYVNFANKTYVYDGQKKSLSISGTLPDGVTVSYENNFLTDAGSVEVVANFIGSPNYNDIAPKYATLTITKAKLSENSIEFNDVTFTYDGLPKTILATHFLPSFVTVTYENNILTNAGSILATVCFDVGNNYEPIESRSATLTVNKASYYTRGIKFNSVTYDYDGVEKTIEIDGYLPEGVSVFYENNTLLMPGITIATAHFVGNENYNQISDMSATLTINKLVVDSDSITINNVTKVYDGNKYNISVSNLIDEVSYVTYDRKEIVDGYSEVGEYDVEVRFIVDENIYESIESKYGHISILPITLTKSDVSITNKKGVSDISLSVSTYTNNSMFLQYVASNETILKVYSISISKIDEYEYSIYLNDQCKQTSKLIAINDDQVIDLHYEIKNNKISFVSDGAAYLILVKEEEIIEKKSYFGLIAYILSALYILYSLFELIIKRYRMPVLMIAINTSYIAIIIVALILKSSVMVIVPVLITMFILLSLTLIKTYIWRKI